MNLTIHSADSHPRQRPTTSLAKLFAEFFYLGLIGFGGGSAVLGLIRRECVEKRKYLEENEFVHGVAFAQILGSYAVNTAFFVGYQMAGLVGALVAVTGFLLPSSLMVVGLSILYFRFHHLPQLQSALAGIGPVVIALILWAAFDTGKGKMKSRTAVAIFVLALLAAYIRINTLWILLAAGTLGIVRCRLKGRSKR